MAITIPQYQTSQPVAVSAGSIITVTPAAGATAVVEYTRGSSVDLINGNAVWAAWPKGSLTSAAADLLDKRAFVRVTAQAGAVTLDINAAPTATDLAAFATDWGVPAAGNFDVNGNLIGIKNGLVALSFNAISRPKTMATVGDSLVSSHEQASFTAFATSGTQTDTRDSNSMLYWLNNYLGAGSINAVVNGAVSGTTWSSAITTQLQNLLSLPATDFVFSIGPGTNDIYNNASPLTSVALIPLAIRYLDAVVARGTIPIMLTIPPRDSALSSTNFPGQTFSTAKLTEHLAFNTWIRTVLPTLYPTAIVIDVWADMVNAANSNSDARAGTTDDGLHFSAGYASDFAQRILVPKLSQYFTPAKPGIFASSDRDTLANWAGSKQIIDYPTLVSTSGGGSAFGGGNSVTGTIAAGNTVVAAGTAMTVVCSVVKAPQFGAGYAQKMAMTATAAGDTAQISAQPTSTRIASGDSYYGAGMLIVENCVGLREISFGAKVVWTAPAAGSLEAKCGTTHNLTNYTSLDAIFAGKTVKIAMVTPYVTLPAGLTISAIDHRLSVTFFAGGSGNVYWYQPSMYKNVTPY